MKGLLYLLIGAFGYTASSQSYPVKNANLEYIVSSFKEYDISKTNLQKIIRDKNGLYWFQGLAQLFSFDGVNWKSYHPTSRNGKAVLIRINDIEVTEDGSIWLATEDGIYIYSPESESFISIRQRFPGIQNSPLAVSRILHGFSGNLVFASVQQEGFYLLNWKTNLIKHISVDQESGVIIPHGEIAGITADKKGNLWGITSDMRGIWNYNHFTGKVLCSWKGELSQFSNLRFKNTTSITYSENENVLWISYAGKGYIEKMYLQTGKSIFYSFTGDLRVRHDTSARNKVPLSYVIIDRENSAWVKVGTKYLVKLNNDIRRMEYLVSDPNMLAIGDWRWFNAEKKSSDTRLDITNNLLWIAGTEKISVIKKLDRRVRHIPFDTSSFTGIHPKDYENTDGRQNVFFVKGGNGMYFLLQQNTGRPKLICFDNNLQIKKVLFNDRWKEYPAFFSPEFRPDTFYIAIMRPEIEPLDFRNIVLKDFRVDLNTFKVEEIKLGFRQRIWRYGYPDLHNRYWLFSNGYLYSYEPGNDLLDSIYICQPDAKDSYIQELVKGYDYPTVLHKNSSTFWIDFIPEKELYKINLKTKKIDTVFKFCMDQKKCLVPGGIYDMYNFDTASIYIQKTFSAMLLHPADNSLTDYFDLFDGKPEIQIPNGSGRYKDWIYYVIPSNIYFLNTISGSQRKLTLNEDFKWPISQFNSPPLVNDRGEMIVMSSINKGFLVFNIDSVPLPSRPGIVNLSFIKVNNKSLPLDSLKNTKALSLKYNRYKNIQIGFSDYSVFDQEKITYEYTLYKGGDTVWNRIEGKPEITFNELSPGKYQILSRAGNDYGDYSNKITGFEIEIIPLFRQTVWFKVLLLTVIGVFFYMLYRYQVRQMTRLQTIRNNIASDLHDDIGSTLNSISIYSEVAKQQAEKDIPALDLIGSNSRKIIESMSDIVWTINPENDSFEKIIVRMRSFAYQLLKAKKVEYTFDADEKLNLIVLPMQVRKNFYLVFKEAITNLVKYSEASRVSISLYEENKIIKLRIRDNGKGIPVNAETRGNGLMNMTRRAREISAELNIVSANSGGTEIELKLKT